MKIRKLAYGFSSILLSVTSLFVLVSPAALAAGNTCTWTGTTDLVFETATNWNCSGSGAGSAPTDGDVLEFPIGVLQGTSGATITILGDRSFAGITVSGSYASGVTGSYKLQGTGTLTLTGLINIASSTSFNFEMNVTIGANIAISSPTSINGIVSFLSSKTLALGAYNISVTGTTSLNVASNITGSGNINVAGRTAQFSGDNSGYSGTFSTTAADAYLGFTNNTSLKGNIIIAAGSSLNISGINYGTSTTIATPIAINGVGSTGLNFPALTIMFNGGSSLGDAVAEFSNVTLSADSSIKVFARNNDTVRFIGSGLSGHTFVPIDGSQGKLIVGSQTIMSKPAISTITDLKQSESIDVFDNQVVIINGERGDTTVQVGGTLKGTGKIANLIVSGGTVAPGQSPGVLNTGNITYTSGILDVEIGGTGAGEYDQLNVTGTVNLGSATTLNITHWNNYRPSQGNSFTIINNDAADAVSGTFAGLAQGATVTVDSIVYTISYTGGDGNDVVLTATTVPSTPNTGFLQYKNNLLLSSVATLLIVTGLVAISRRIKVS